MIKDLSTVIFPSTSISEIKGFCEYEGDKLMKRKNKRKKIIFFFILFKSVFLILRKVDLFDLNLCEILTVPFFPSVFHPSFKLKNHYLFIFSVV